MCGGGCYGDSGRASRARVPMASLSRVPRGGRARIARPPRLDLSAHASAPAYVAMDARRARAWLAETRPAPIRLDSDSPALHKRAQAR